MNIVHSESDKLAIMYLVFAAPLGLLAYSPDIAPGRKSGLTADDVAQRPLTARTLWLCACGASLGTGLFELAAPPTIAESFAGHAACVSAIMTLVIWTALGLAPLGRVMPQQNLPDQISKMLRVFGRGPWQALAKGCGWGAPVSALIGIPMAIFHTPRFSRPTDAAPFIALAILIGITFGMLGGVAMWAGGPGEYARSGTLPPPLRNPWNRSDPN